MVSGASGSGKSNTIALIYTKLLKFAEKHLFINMGDLEAIESDKAEISSLPLVNQDFIAVFKFKRGATVALISRGDDEDAKNPVCFIEDYKKVEKYNPDILITAERIFPRKRPIYNYVVNELGKDGFAIKLHMVTSLESGFDPEMEETISDAVLFYLEKHNIVEK